MVAAETPASSSTSTLAQVLPAATAAAGQFVALLYAKLFGAQDADAVNAIQPWAKKQMAYMLGNNPLGKSYMMGFTNNYCSQPHHAAGHASIWGEPGNPVENRHIIWGALVNGPDGNDGHIDNRDDFGSNEVTIDYNASLIAALAAQYALQGAGQCPLAKFPPDEPEIDEYYTLSALNGASGCRSQVTVTLINETIHPPRYNEHLSVKYFFDISELQAAGKSISDVTASLIYDRGANEWKEPTSLSAPELCPKSASTYYVELGFETYKFWGRIVQLKAPRTFMLDIGTQNGQGCVWDPSNDWSYANLKATPAAGMDPPKTPHIAVYSGGILAWGEEPPCFDMTVQPQPPPAWIP
jgi:endoglucanase